MTHADEQRILLATDLDRTLLPNGPQPESPGARPRFRRFVARPEVVLVYITGRHRALVEQAKADFDLPLPDFVIGDVGTSVYAMGGNEWQLDRFWSQRLADDWRHCRQTDLAGQLEGLLPLRLQEPDRQTPYKLSYYAEATENPEPLLRQVRERLGRSKAHCNIVWSVNETTSTGLLDILPVSASKLHALEFLRRQLKIPLERTVFAGDSGNDIEVLESEVPAVLVANAQESVRTAAIDRAAALGNSGRLYLARGDLPDLNGNYAAGILEGVAHYIPETLPSIMG
jgi:sucrose-6-phosphatase